MQQKNKILNILSYTAKGGVAAYYNQMNIGLKELGFQVYSCFASFRNSLKVPGTTRIFAPWIRVKLLFPVNLIFLLILNLIIKPDIIFIHNGRIAKILKLISFKNQKIIAINHGLKATKLNNIPNIIAVNLDIISEYKSHNYQNKLFLLTPSITEQFNSKSKILYPTKTIRIGSYGRFTKEKGFDFLIGVAAELEQLGCRFDLTIGGDGNLKKKLIKQAKLLKLKNIKFIGWVKNKQEFFDNIDIFCLPSYEESFGIVILEAMANGVPVISTKCHGPLYIIDDGRTGILSNMVQREFAEKIILLSKQPDVYNAISRNALLDFQQKHSFNVFKENMLRIINNC